MDVAKDVIEVAWLAGGKIWLHARGNPAILVAGVVVAAATGIAYGTYKYGSKFLERVDS